MVFVGIYSTFILISIFQILTALAFNIDNRDNIALYWGQNSQGSQESLATYCNSNDANIFVLSFMDIFPNSMGLNFANACTETFSDNNNNDNLLHCSKLAKDIETCQNNGNIVLLSLGGASGAYGFTNDAEAEDFALTLWNTFGEGPDRNTVNCPFDNVLIDGFDFDIENNNGVGYAALVNKLREYFDNQGSKQYYISAAPQCPYPDASVGDLLSNAKVDFAFIQFYNNYCNVDKQFNWDTWNLFAQESDINRDIKLYLGLPGSATAASSGYISDLAVLQNTVDTIESNENFGGIALWDASQAYNNKIKDKSYITIIRSLLETDSVDITAPTSTISDLSATASVASSSYTNLEILTTSTIREPLSTLSTINIESSTTPNHSTKVSSTLQPVLITSTSSILTSSPTTRITTTLEPDVKNKEIDAVSEVETTMTTAQIHSTTHFMTTSLIPESVSSPSTLSITTSIVASPSVSNIIETSATSSNNVAVTTTLAPVHKLISITTLSPITSLVSTTTLAPQSATTPTFDVMTTLPATNSNDVHAKAQELNSLYSQGLFNGVVSGCNDGDYACDSNGSIAVCNLGEWIVTPCASGTTCYAFDQDDEVYTQCNYIHLKNNFL